MWICQVDTDDGTCDRMDPEVCQVDTNDGRGDRMDPEVCKVYTGDETGDRIEPGGCKVDRHNINLPRMVGVRRRQPISPLWQ